MELIERMLAEAGFKPNGFTQSWVAPTKGTHIVGGKVVGGRLIQGRKRFRRGSVQVSVGPRTVCVYTKTATINCKTKETLAIAAAIAKLTQESLEGNQNGLNKE